MSLTYKLTLTLDLLYPYTLPVYSYTKFDDSSFSHSGDYVLAALRTENWSRDHDHAPVCAV